MHPWGYGEIVSAPDNSLVRGAGREKAVGPRTKTHLAIASQEHRVLHNGGRNDADPHGERTCRLFSPEELEAQADACRSS